MTDENDPSGAEPSGLGRFASLDVLRGDLGDGGFRTFTAYEGSTPLASAVPHDRPVPDPGRGADPDVPVKLSRFAYLRRQGSTMRVETPLTSAYAEVHDPRVGGLVVAMAFEATPRDLAARTGLGVESACTVIGLLVALGIALPVSRRRSPEQSVRSAVEWAVGDGVLAGRVDPRVVDAVCGLAAYGRSGALSICWELHHDGSRRVDVSVLRDETDPSLAPYFEDTAFVEYDAVDDRLVEMGTFRTLRPPPAGFEPVAWLQEAAVRGGSSSDLLGNAPIHALTRACGPAVWLGFVTQRREGLRVLFAIRSREVLAALIDVLADAGVGPTVLARLRMLATVVGGGAPAQLAVDATATGLGPRIGVEFFEPGALRLLPGVLDALGLDGNALEELSASLATPEAQHSLVDSGGAVTDVHVAGHHGKVTFDGGEVSAKSYLWVRSTRVSHAGSTVEDFEVPPTWEFHDLLFHSQVRDGRVRRRLGGTARFAVIPDAPSEFRADPRPGDIVLPDIDIDRVIGADRPFGEVMRARVSDRDWNGPDLTLTRLAELLARVCEPILRPNVLTGDPLGRVGHAYPSGGGLYETDIVVLANRVTELEAGAYLYRAASHSLTPLRGSSESVQALLFSAGEATGGGASTPQAMLVCAARFPDLAVKYEGIAYALMVKHVGVLMATASMAATAMGLGSVSIGTGNSDTFAAATGLDYYRHGSTGEIAISVPPEQGAG